MTTGYVEQGALLDSRCFRPKGTRCCFRGSAGQVRRGRVVVAGMHPRQTGPSAYYVVVITTNTRKYVVKTFQNKEWWQPPRSLVSILLTSVPGLTGRIDIDIRSTPY
jgi:hypothetical protein